MQPEKQVRPAPHAHLSCPFCQAYDVSRLFVASVDVDSCECGACGSRWDESRASGDYRGRARRASAVIPGG